MRLDFSGAPEVAAPPERVWEKLLDHKLVASCAPGVETVEALDERHFRVVTAFGVGAIKVRFRLDVELAEVHPPNRLKLSARGKAPGSEVHVDTTLRLEALAGGRTRLNWQAAADVHGSVASVGARLLGGTARKLTESFWKTFAAKAGARGRK